MIWLKNIWGSVRGGTVSREAHIVLYRSAVVGFNGTFYLPNNLSISGIFSANEHAHIMIDHELVHSQGIELGNNRIPHAISNQNGINRCMSFNLCM
jgi:hypothetical protein